VLLGVRDGLLVGAVAELIFSVLNPYGAVHPFVTATQVTGMIVPGIAGGVAAHARVPELPIPLRAMALAAIGAVLAVFFDFVTNLGTGLVYGQIGATLIGGIPFALWHLFWNVVLFAVLGTPLVAVFAHYRARLA
jgi:uncharacterized membrane protein